MACEVYIFFSSSPYNKVATDESVVLTIAA